MENRCRGALIGLAIGDALGAAVEFREPGSFEPVTGFRDGGPHGLSAGEWTDDTSMALALADSIATSGWNLNDQAERYVRWWKTGLYSVNGRCFDIGVTTRHVERTLSGLDALVLETNYDADMLWGGKYPGWLKARIAGPFGHLDNRESERLLGALDRSRLKHVVAAHLSQHNNTPELARAALARALNCEESWIGLATWALTTRRPLAARDRVIAGWMAVVFTAVFFAGTVLAALIARNWAGLYAMGMGALMLVLAIRALVKARRRFAELAARRAELERTLA